MKYKKILLIAFFLSLFVFQQIQVDATMLSAEEKSQVNIALAPNILFPTIKVYVYPLAANGTLLNPGSPVLCEWPNDVNLGTYGCGNMDSDNDGVFRNPDYLDVESYYLKDIIATEMNVIGISPEIEALKAQAIASRTVASWKAKNQPWVAEYGSIN